ncbi:hypothetical protein [Cellvibrio mixtus]|uniref:hypothetical protein n=1 Tax=Cellvibrio mixtus TaxID=39650 RepID=UPI000586F789|nr:hypothetical protein [Cellvibrio mixtus]
MDALWLLAGPDRCYRVPDRRIIVDKRGSLLDGAEQFLINKPDVEFTENTLAALFDQVDVVILVAGSELLNKQWLESIPAKFPKVGFLYETSTPEARLQLTVIGVDGYISVSMTQPDFEVVLQKIHEEKQSINNLLEELKNFSAIAFTAMSSASEMGTVAVFAEKVQSCMELHRLANLIQVSLGDLGLDCIVQFIFENDITIFPVDVPVSYLRLLQSANESETRIISHGRFLLFSFEHVQLLVTNAPHLDQERYGRLRDVLAHVVSIAEARAKTLKVNTLLKIQQDNARMVMMLLEMAAVDNRTAVKTIMTELSDSLRVMATGFDLNMEQESQLLTLSERALNSLEGLQETTMAVEVHFRSLLQQLDEASNLLQPPQEHEQEIESFDSKIELF